jgi:enoyl-CoA hydratase/carnithine racemase
VIAAASDIRIAAENAKIAFLFTRVGLAGADMGAVWLLPRIVGMAHASELLMLGDFISAERAWQIGLYNRVVPGERLMAEATEIAARLARGPSAALGVTKQALNEEAGMNLATAIEYEAQVQAKCMEDPNYREAYEAFRGKREAKFK